mmetsp:Transcript_105253/g.177883  ORF Transcript_105253/g.177883 Transcript_105253/m.177883 type:complete len:96 (+) Transcript_105253:47-334(+)
MRTLIWLRNQAQCQKLLVSQVVDATLSLLRHRFHLHQAHDPGVHQHERDEFHPSVVEDSTWVLEGDIIGEEVKFTVDAATRSFPQLHLKWEYTFI